MKQYKSAVLVFLVLLFSEMKGEAQGSISFIENKKQWEDVIKFKSEIRGGALFFEANAITYAFYDPEYLEKIAALKTGRIYGKKTNVKMDSLVECYAYRMHFDNASKNVAVRGHSPLQEYHNYYLGNNPERWSTDVRLYEQVEYANIYSGINLLFYEKDGTYKYEFKLAPYTDVEQIAMRYEGADKLFLRKGSLIVKVGKHETEERKPYSYQIDEDGNKKEIACDFVLEGKTVHFVLGSYDRSKELIIDPTLIFASYSGSTVDNWGFTATYDNAGNLYGGGTVFGIGYPTAPLLGCYQSMYGGGQCDIGITKFNSNGTQRLYSTYLGGNYSDVPHSMIVSDNNELYILATTSSRNYPITATAYDTVFRGGPACYNLTNNIYYNNGASVAITCFNASGTQLLGSTFFGGSGIDGLSADPTLAFNYSDEFRGEIQLDASHNVYIVSSTSSQNLPVSSNAFQRNYGGGSQDGFIAKFNYSLQNLQWCSYFGGSSADAIYSMTLDMNDNVYICGGTTSNDIPITNGSIQPIRPGDRDGFVAKIINNGGRILNSTYYGRAGYDQTYLVTLDKSENVYVMGQTDTTAAAWIKGSVWSSGSGQFVSKLSNNLSNVIWSTSFGSSSSNLNISPTALMVDICGNIHISGWGAGLSNKTHLSTFGLPTTWDALSQNTSGSNFYFISLEKDASNLLYATFYGGQNTGDAEEHVDGGTSRFDKRGIIYQAVCAGCGGRNTFPTTPGVVSPTKTYGVNCNLGVIKLDYGLQSVVADFSIPSEACAPVTINFQNNSQTFSNNTTFFWNFGDGRNDTVSNPTHVYANSGTYRIKLVVSDPSACNIKDSIEKQIVILSNTKDTYPAQHVCKGDQIQIGRPPMSGAIYRWTPTVGLNNYTISNPIFEDTVSRQYTLYVSNGQCADTFTQWVYVSSFPDGKQRNVYGCLGDTLRLDADTSNGANYFVISSNSGFTDTLNRPLSQSYIKTFLNQDNKTYYVYRSDGYCHARDTLKVYASSFSISIDSVRHLCSGDTVQLSTNILNSTYGSSFTYQWTPTSAIVGSSTAKNPRVAPKDSAYLFVIIKNEYNCTQKDSVLIGVSHLKINPVQKDISCFGLTDGSISVTVLGGILPYSYKWSNSSANTNIIADLRAGTYTVSISDAYNCTVSQTFKIIEPAKLSVHLEDTIGLVFCDDQSSGQALAVGSGGVAPYRFAWITGDTTAFIDHLYAGNYFLQITDKNGCEDSVTFAVRDTSDMEVRDISKGVSCFGACDGNILLQIITAVDPTNILWKTGETAIFRDSLCAGIYDVVVTDYQHCRRRLFPKVADIAPISISKTTIIHPYCFGMKDGSISVIAAGGTPPYKYYWDGGAEGDSILSGLTESGQYHLHITDSKDCEFDTIFVLPPYDTLSATTHIVHTPCEEVCLGKASVQVSGGVKPYLYDWSNGENTYAIDSLCQGEYWVVVSDANQCEIKVQVEIGLDSTIFYKKVMAWADTTEIYRSLSVTLYGTDLGSDFSYDWSPSDGLLSTKGTKVTAKPQNTIVYTYTVTDKYGCQKSDTLLIIIKDVICEDPYIFVPNTFSPNGDNINDILYVRGLTLISIDFAIYDRWGERVFASKDPQIGWDGTYKGKPCNPDVYVYYLTATCIGGTEYVTKGNITLMR